MLGATAGAYGFQILGLRDHAPGLLKTPTDWPELRIVREGPVDRDEIPAPGTIQLDDQRVVLWLVGGDRLEIVRSGLTAHLATSQTLSDEAIIHPYLGLTAAFASRWLGRHVLHGGAFLLNGEAWGVIAEKAGGKSSTLAALHEADVPVLTDDVLVLEGTTVFAGPRSIDLRESSAALLGGEALGFLGTRERWRLRPGAVPPAVPLAGFVHLEWGDELLIEPLESRERLSRLIAQSFPRPEASDALQLLELAARPAWRLSRPNRLSLLEESMTRLLETLA